MKFKDFIINNKFKDFLFFEKKLKENLKKGTFSKINVGDIFEEFNFFYFKINNEKLNIKNCWRQKDIPLNIKEKLKLKNDEGADGVIETHDNKSFIYPLILSNLNVSLSRIDPSRSVKINTIIFFFIEILYL